jgi:hypothetical protein
VKRMASHSVQERLELIIARCRRLKPGARSLSVFG